MTIFKTNFLDTIFAPTTAASVFLNISTIMSIQIIHSGFTILISSMSVVYLWYKIKNEKNRNDKKN